jgi:hypothetical protein
MGNPFTTGGFNCCTCPEPPDYDPSVDPPLATYINRCGCPSVAVVCTSEEKNAVMCGQFDPDDFGTEDGTNVYTNREITGEVNRYVDGPRVATTVFSRDEDGECTSETTTEGSENCEGFTDGSSFYKKRLNTFTPDSVGGNSCGGSVSGGSAVFTSEKSFSESGGCETNYTDTGSDATVTIGSTCNFPCEPSSSGGLGYGQSYSGSGTIPYDSNGFWQGTVTGTITIDESCDDGPITTESYGFLVSAGSSSVTSYAEPLDQEGTEGTAFTVEDTETAALEAATAVADNSCSSEYQLRTRWGQYNGATGFTKRTVTYTATAKNLVIGARYEGCVRIRKRESYSGIPPAGADLDWEDVEPDNIAAFEATSDEEEVATDVEVPNARGYEYEIVGAHVWIESANCDCPTSYTA